MAAARLRVHLAQPPLEVATLLAGGRERQCFAVAPGSGIRLSVTPQQIGLGGREQVVPRKRTRRLDAVQ